MKKFLSILLILTNFIAYGQEKSLSRQSGIEKEIKKERISDFLDSLKVSLLKDTVNFSRTNLIHSAGITQNTKSNSPLFIVNGKYSYKLDIVEGKKVVEFTEELLDSDRIKSITIVMPKYSGAIYGSLGKHGTILITLKKQLRFAPEVAGLNIKSRNNFDQRLPGEKSIRH